MMENNIINTIRTENFILIIYFFIVGISLIANNFEIKYYEKGFEKDKDTYRNLNIFIFTIALIIYVYFFSENYKELILLCEASDKKIFLNKLNVIAAGSIVLAGAILLYIAITDTELDTEISFT